MKPTVELYIRQYSNIFQKPNPSKRDIRRAERIAEKIEKLKTK